jgi:FKBP-type peptidyl-prolyl cis-trans isomerase
VGETAPTSNRGGGDEAKAKKQASTKPAPPTAKGETKTTEGGVKYETLKEGTGPELKLGQKAAFHYVGKLSSGDVFDSSRSAAPPKPFDVTLGEGQVISGWEEGLPGMKVGEIRKLTIPPEMGYGKMAKPKIPPNSTLVFEVELVEIK